MTVFRSLLAFLVVSSAIHCASATEIRVVMELSPPQQTIVDGEITGTVTLKVKSMLEKAGYRPSFEVYPWSRAFEIARSIPNVLIVNMARTDEREEQFHWLSTVHKYQFGLVALGDRQDLFIDSLDDAKRYTVAVQRGDFSVAQLVEYGFEEDKNLFITSSITESWQLLQKGKVDFIVEDPENLEEMSNLLLGPLQTAEYVLPIKSLEVDTWIAANLDSEPSLINSLKVQVQ